MGPPGTGKTHTIANLIGHLLAKGRTVLVTSQTSKALGEVRKQVVADLRPLCIPLLESDQESLNDLTKCVNGIVDHLQQMNSAEKEEMRLVDLRAVLWKEISDLKARITTLQRREVDPIIIGGQEHYPIDAAKWLSNNLAGNEWIPSPIHPETLCPLTMDDVSFLYSSNEFVSTDDERDFREDLPSIESMMPIPDFENIVSFTGRFSNSESIVMPFVIKPISSMDSSVLSDIQKQLADALTLMKSYPWSIAAINDGKPGSERRALWLEMIETHKIAHQAQNQFDSRVGISVIRFHE